MQAPKSAAISMLLMQALATAAAAERPNIVLVTIDTWRWDHLGAAGSPVPTPQLDALARAGTRFENTYATAPITLPSHASLHTGLYPFHHGVRANGFYRLGEQHQTLAEELKQAGWTTAAFLSGFPLESRFGLAQGFETYDDEFTRVEGAGSAYEAERIAEQTVARARDWLETAPSPFFIWVHLYDPHAEYEPPEPFRERHADHPYRGEVAYVDREVGRLWDGVGEKRQTHTILLVAGDHGESLGEHGEKTHTVFVYDATIRVPMFVAGPGIRPESVIERPVSLVDVTPTLLELARRPAPNGDGVSLAASLRDGSPPPDRPVYFESYVPRLEFGWSQLLGIRQDRYKLIRAPATELYDLSEDPTEESNRATKVPGIVSRLERSLDDLLGDDAVGEQSPADLDEEAIRQLQSLGYLEGESAPQSLRSNGAELPDPKQMIEVQARIDNAIRLLNRGRLDATAAALREVLKRDPGNAFALQLLSATLVRQGRPPEAVELLRAAPDRLPDLTRSALHATAGDILRRTGQFAESVTELELSLELDSGNLQAMNILALTRLAQGRLDDGEELLEGALEIAPGHARSLSGLGEIALARSDPERARGLFAQALEDPSVRARALFGLALADLVAEEPGEARKRLGRLAGLPDEMTTDPELLQRAGTLAADLGDLEASISLFRRAAALAEASASLQRDLGVALSRAGELSEAIEHLHRARELAPEDAAAANALGTALARAGRMQEAAEAFEQAVALDPGNELARENLALARRALEEQ